MSAKIISIVSIVGLIANVSIAQVPNTTGSVADWVV